MTIPKDVRDSLGLVEGDEVIFRVEASRATLRKTQDFLEQAGTIDLPHGKRGTQWDEVLRRTRRARADKRR